MRILFIATHRANRAPSQRFRFEQYFDYFKEQNIEFKLSNIISKKDDEILYAKGKYFQKALILIKSYYIRFKDLLSLNKYDIVFIHREALLIGSSFFEKRMSKSKAKLVFDFDDAIWLKNISDNNKNLSWIKNFNKTQKIIGISDAVICGNQYLCDYAKQFNSNTFIIPTTIDTDYHLPITHSNKNEKICIGWTGSHTTITHFETIIPVLKKIKEKYQNLIYFKVIGDSNYENKELGIKGHAWSIQTEIEDLQELNIGIMPLPDDKWSKGKCGFKGLQYMALKIPSILSPVGVNTTIIQHEKNGYLASTEDEWIDILSNLIESKELRTKIGQEGRKTIINEFSVNSQKETYLKIFNSLIS